MIRNKFAQLAAEPIFIIGSARSGTTWVHDIFKAHPEVATLFETWLFTKQDGIGSLFSSAHWPAKYSGLGRLLEREQLLLQVRSFCETIMSSAILDAHRFLVEKSPSHAFSLDLINEIFPKSRFIHVVRDGRDVAVSVQAAARSWVPHWKMTFGKSLMASAKAWHDSVKRVKNHAGVIGGERFLEVRYEKLHEDPMHTYRTMFDFCDIPYDENLLRRIYEKTDFSKNYKPGEDKFRRGGRVGDWKREYSMKDAIIFQAVAGSMLITLGYENDGKWVLKRPGKR